ncbi:MAG: mannose-1-phosphate guanylyltransferase/mannose-6-phosphate isomerase [Rhodobacterales bacterium 17-64-5]|nr:MAG: mannose-1-phosphate guanylyltransferase/mannose-6-phosphate isomerase [Rhodobacterales bacterium 17-64-5]
MPLITPVLLAGGSGTRLWPVSRARYPKQFVPLVGEESLFQAAVRRFGGPGFAPAVVVTADDFRFIVTEQLAAASLSCQSLLLEPVARNTAGAALAATLHLARSAPEALMLLAPSDQLIPDAAAFRAAVLRGVPAAEDGQIVTFGIAPTRAETGYGWLECGAETHPGVERLSRFIEKPDLARASRLLADPRYLWNAGLFLVRADVLLAAARLHAPDLMRAVEPALAGARTDLGFTRLDAGAWSDVPAISIDHAIMEKAANLSVVRYAGHWTDLGSWVAVLSESPRDVAGNALQGTATGIDCENTLLLSDNPGIELVGIGLRNLVAVATRDAVLVADLDAAQSVRLAVDQLRAKGAAQATGFARDHRPWGWFETLAAGEHFQVKRIHVHPGAALSLQSHRFRAEHWVVVEGTARVTVGDSVSDVAENQSIYVPLGAVHRLENAGTVPVVLIEVQTGTYFGEDDITRYEDRYARD